MSALAHTCFTPFFIDGPAGPLFSIYHGPHSGVADAGDLIFVAPFAEELNRSRRMAALQARALAAAGVGVLLLDLFGTGDSGGDFRDARWEIWREDVIAAADWLAAQGRRRVGLWGLRLGSLLALEVAAERIERFDRIVLWQPVVSGETMFTQFLRMRVAAGMGGDGEGETTKGLREVLAAGSAIEVAGYEVDPALAVAIDAARIDRIAPFSAPGLDWLELVAEPDRPLAPANRRAIERWREGGGRAAPASVVGDPFWTLQDFTLSEPIVAPELIAATVRLFDREAA